ncbi:SusC/RagA family TonB-linked outer membrane protein [Mucilaginibacter sp. FT3.2]|uniref:SusC/RagA family TonB-linked outer membrane protein n=1 Tax=Mucilaginibacter sp. FT3.2 TaxID=2723090 RepID=UPI00160CF25F|nr:SusC/RagA family TonB-linked outer membrane protein [Mucilaginibacter sp. FT3.2]MBB6232490.1 TonB-linked SusC/RagA family outer membrane protein [Mucilaginibacter sp. FT3.2]
MKKTILFIVLATLCLNFKALAQLNTTPNVRQVQGKVTDEQGNPLPGATIKIKNGTVATSTDKEGKFVLSNLPLKGALTVSFVGFQTLETSIPINYSNEMIIRLKADANSLNEVQVIGYGTTTKRLNTGSISTISSADIEKQPVTNVLSAISGRASGVFVQQANGLPGGGVNIQIRGKGSILAGTNPLYVIDGVPFSSTPVTYDLSTSSLNGAVSPFNSINPDDIESISILKDVDATAIYGSRGSNGVVLITTKQGKAGKTKVDLNLSRGFNTIASYPSVLNLQQYLQLRREAFKNDGLTPSSDPTSSSYAPDLTIWSQTESTNFPKYLLGSTGHVTNFQGSVSGGDKNTTFSIGGNYHSETTVLIGDSYYQRGGLRYSLQHHSLNNKFSISLSGTYTLDNNRLIDPALSFQGDLFLPPNFPLRTPVGDINWASGINPLGDSKAQSIVKTNNFVTNLVLKYNISSDLTFSSSVGYNKINIDQTQTFPKSSQNPAYSPINSAIFNNSSNQSIIVEPQLNYKKQFKNSTLNLLTGGTFQSSLNQGLLINVSNFSNDALLNNISSAGSIDGINNSYLQYKYVSVFGRANYNINDKYIVNASIRRDGSSRFGPGNQFGTFGAVGAAWLFSKENWFKNMLPFISYGKLRGSYGIVGNDQIPDYQYLSTYSNSGQYYQDIAGLQPSRISNADFHWEVNKKLEAAIELGFFTDRILLTVNRYQSRSSNQLVSYAIPTITGFKSYQANLPAVVQNTGWEFELNTKNIQEKDFSWTTTFNITVPKNKLVSFQNLAGSSYANTLVIGEDITRVYGYRLTSVDPSTGNATYAPQPGSTSTSPYFYNTIGKTTPDFYGGFGNTFTYKHWQLDIFGQFVKQMARGDILYSPGIATNSYQYLLNRWQKPGDITNVPKASTNIDYNFAGSSVNYFDASYFRLKNVALSYTLTKGWASSLGIDQLKIYGQGQNLYTLWHKNNPFLDPESGAFGYSANLPPMRSIVLGVQITF